MNTTIAAAIAVAALTIPYAPKAAAQANHETACGAGTGTVAGTVRDSTGALVAEATVALENGATASTTSDGRFSFRCVSNSSHHLQITAPSFAALGMNVGHLRTDLNITLLPEQVEQAVDVASDEPAHGVDNTENSGASRTLQGDALKALADDPDDLKRQLQQLTAGNGGDPTSAIITVDGFQSPTNLPPKSAIAYIRINPDPFSAEYQEPPYMGGRVEVYTKPGSSHYHGALFMAYGGSALNARDPFSTAKGTLGKQRYGFELNGPVRKQGSDFALALQHRTINTVAVVNAVSLDSAGNTVPVNQTVPTPQAQWEGSARLGWQLGPRNTFIANYTVFQQGLTNLGVGGTNLAEQGYNATHYEHVARFTDITTISSKVMHEGRVSFRWGGDLYYPTSTAPQVQVSGAFTGGGAPLGAQQQREFLVNVLDDAIITTAKHTLKFGVDARIAREHQTILQNANGMYTFGGGTAPVLDSHGNATAPTEIISGLEQYRRAKLGLAGGTPTAYTAVTGSPTINFVQMRAGFFLQDDWKLLPNLKVSAGLRWQVQNRPSTAIALMPRAGVAWSPDKKQVWTLRAHAGLFAMRFSTEDATEFERLGNPVRNSFITYSPTFGNPASGKGTIRTIRTIAPKFQPAFFAEQSLGVERGTKHLAAGADLYLFRIWNEPIARNINTPLNGDPYGPRPFAANLNILQSQNAGFGDGKGVFAHAVLQGYKPVNLFVGYVYVAIKDFANNNTFDQPQSNTSNAGEYVPRGRQNTHTVILNGTAHLPGKLDLSTETSLQDGNRYNVTTGFDNNGDGTFNDRPQFAKPGDPNAIQTPFGLLVASGGTGVTNRNLGKMPWRYYVDANLNRVWTLNPHADKDHLQTLQANVRTANLINHTNVNQVGGVLGSPLFMVPYAADTGRRIEFGLRYGF